MDDFRTQTDELEGRVNTATLRILEWCRDNQFPANVSIIIDEIAPDDFPYPKQCFIVRVIADDMDDLMFDAIAEQAQLACLDFFPDGYDEMGAARIEEDTVVLYFPILNSLVGDVAAQLFPPDPE